MLQSGCRKNESLEEINSFQLIQSKQQLVSVSRDLLAQTKNTPRPRSSKTDIYKSFVVQFEFTLPPVGRSVVVSCKVHRVLQCFAPTFDRVRHLMRIEEEEEEHHHRNNPGQVMMWITEVIHSQCGYLVEIV